MKLPRVIPAFRFGAIALAWTLVVGLAAIDGAVRTGLQDARCQAPADFYPGAIAFYGEISKPAGDGTREIRLISEWGHFKYKITRLGSAPGEAPRSDDIIPRKEKAPTSRELTWNTLAAGPLWLEGEIVSAREHGRLIEGRFAFQNEVARLRLELLQTEVGGPTPAPTLRSINYGADFRQTLDVYLAKARGPTPVAVYIHGGSWTGRDKTDMKLYQPLLEVGITVIAVNYRLIPPQNPDAATPAVSIPLRDAARAIQFIRVHAKEWNILPDRLGIWGESAGACTALWLATHADLADPKAADAISRASSRPRCVVALIPQTSLDPQQMRDWVGPELNYGPHAFGITDQGGGKTRFDRFLATRSELLPWIAEYSPAALLIREGPPIFMDYGERGLAPRANDTGYFTHSPRFGLGFQALAERIGRECYLKYNGREPAKYFTWHAFMIAQLVN